MIGQIISQFYYRFTKPKEANQETEENKYSPKYIAGLLAKKEPNGRVFFHFNNRSDYITLSSKGQLNVRGKEEMFRAWGNSEFRTLKPQAVFEELEKEIVQIRIISATGRINRSFSSYGEFMNWLAGEGEKKRA
jgi:hypothetical protein